jgi:hypothetical protein
MLEQVHIRINDHQILNGVKEYSVEVAVPGRYVHTFIGASQADFAQSLTDSFRQIFTLLGIPENVAHAAPIIPTAVDEQPTVKVFHDEHGNIQPMSGFASTAKATFAAQVIRNGKVVED